MSVRELHYAIDINLDRIASQSTPDLNAAEKDWLLNEAQMMLIKQRFSALSNPKRQGVEASQKRVDDLATLIVKYPAQVGITPTTNSGVAEVDLSLLSYPYLFFLSAHADVVNEDCTFKIPLKFVQHDDYRDALKDPFNSPSLEFIPFNFGLASSNFQTPSMFIYPGTLTLGDVYVEYIRRPARVSLGTYAYIDGTIYPEQTLELPEHLHMEVVDLACQIAAYATQVAEYAQLRTQKVLINE